MHEAAASVLKGWESFYVIVGSSAGALTGLQFVVLTIIAELGTSGDRKETIAAFGSPNIVHFCAALLLSAILSAPWGSLHGASIVVTATGALGVAYIALVLARTLRQKAYRPVLEDWMWHDILPALSYTAITAAGAVLGVSPVGALFVIAAALLMLLFIGIHNTWDSLTFVTSEMSPARAGEGGGAGEGRAGGRPGGAAGAEGPGKLQG
jgi:hypothetical protein